MYFVYVELKPKSLVTPNLALGLFFTIYDSTVCPSYITYVHMLTLRFIIDVGISATSFTTAATHENIEEDPPTAKCHQVRELV